LDALTDRELAERVAVALLTDRPLWTAGIPNPPNSTFPGGHALMTGDTYRFGYVDAAKRANALPGAERVFLYDATAQVLSLPGAQAVIVEMGERGYGCTRR